MDLANNRYIVSIKAMFKDIADVIFLDLCLACNSQHRTHGSLFCTNCLAAFPFTDHFDIKQNPVTQHLAGRVAIEHGAALLTFSKEGIVQRIIHQLKYQGRHEVGAALGKMAAIRYQQSNIFNLPDIIIPVPIHPKKMKVRGYNQSAIFGISIGQYLGLECNDEILIKIKETASQTGKSRTERVVNVANGFTLTKPNMVENKHVLVVDDVITTGATLEACCHCIYDAGASKISVLCMAAP